MPQSDGGAFNRSQDKGFHVEKALVHVFTRSLPYPSAQALTVEETVDGLEVEYNLPAELSDYMFRYSASMLFDKPKVETFRKHIPFDSPVPSEGFSLIILPTL